MLRFTLVLWFVSASVSLSGQTISVTFSGTGAATQIDNVTATNLRTGRSVTLPGNQTLILTSITGISEISELTNPGMVFPNPFSGKATFTASVHNPQPVDIKLRNLAGQVVAQLKESVQPGENEFAISVNAAGIFVVSLTTDQGTTSYKVICTDSNTPENSIQYLGSSPNNPNNPNNHNTHITHINPFHSPLKTSQTSYTLGFTTGDMIHYGCKSGNYSTILTDSPASSKNYEVEFVGCTDPDGKNYSTVKIGKQTWMAENLAYLPSVSGASAGSESSPSYYVYGYQGAIVAEAKAAGNYSTYGVLYNWVAAKSACPAGWHLPSDAEWTGLTDYLSSSAGGKMKETGTVHWLSPNYGATNSSGFTALPGGNRTNSGNFANLGYGSYLWSSSEGVSPYAESRVVNYEEDGVNPVGYYRSGGFSVRCVLSASGIVQNDIAAVDSKITAFMSTYKIPGASLAVSKNGKLVYMKGFGVADQVTNEKVTPDMRFRLASISKTHTAVAIMKLFQENKINLDGKVFGTGSILGTDFGTAPYKANLTAITVRQLLHHITGAWGGSTGLDVIDYNPAYTDKQLLDWIIDTRPMPYAPGTFFDYSNVNYFILARIIEKVSGQTYFDYLKSILNSIGDTETEIAGKTLAERKPLEVKYYGQGTDAQYVYNIAFPRRTADGGLITTAKGLLRLVTAVDGFDTRPDIFNAATLTQFIKPSTVFTSYACGIGIWSAQNLWYNGGSLPGTRTWFMRHDNGMCVALLLNSRPDLDPGSVFTYAMQDVCLDIVKNAGYRWQDIDQF